LAKDINGDFMFVTLIRTVILYIIVVVTMRILGKRQIGELQPTELVITLLLSEIIAVPMQDNDIPLTSTIIPVLLLVGFEILISVISLKSVKIRTVIQGHSLVIIRDGKLDLKQIKKLRFTIDDVLEALRQKDIFDISKVQYAIVETNGSMSVMLKPEYEPVTREDLKLKTEDNGLSCSVIIDGTVMKDEFQDCNLTEEKFNKLLKKEKITVENTLLMTVDKKGKITVIGKEGK
jgi:uncharacterized membrane protein YcaP (DUF421 family)